MTTPDILPGAASSGTFFAVTRNPLTNKPFGSHLVRFSISLPGASCDAVGGSYEKGLVGDLGFWSGSQSEDLPAGIYPMTQQLDPQWDGSTFATFDVRSADQKVIYAVESGTVTITSGTGGHLVGSFEAECNLTDSRPGAQDNDTVQTVSGSFDAPLCASSSEY